MLFTDTHSILPVKHQSGLARITLHHLQVKIACYSINRWRDIPVFHVQRLGHLVEQTIFDSKEQSLISFRGMRLRVCLPICYFKPNKGGAVGDMTMSG